MSKYEEALDKIGNCYVASEGKDLMFSEEYSNSYDAISEAITKADKYDELCKHNVFEDEEIGENLIDSILNQNNRLIERRDELKARCKKMSDEYDAEVKENDILRAGLSAIYRQVKSFNESQNPHAISFSCRMSGYDADDLSKAFELMYGKDD